MRQVELVEYRGLERSLELQSYVACMPPCLAIVRYNAVSKNVNLVSLMNVMIVVDVISLYTTPNYPSPFG